MVRGDPIIYHTGDTDLFSDMALVSQKQDRYYENVVASAKQRERKADSHQRDERDFPN
jgi:hypothetical protein